MRIFRSIQVQPCLTTLALAAALGSVASGAAAAPAVRAASGSYNLGVDTSVGATASPTTSCGSAGTDALVFTGSGANSIGIHSYSCGFSNYDFGSRSSGENTYFVNGLASVIGDIDLGLGGTLFGFVIDSGQVGAFGSTAFGAAEYQESQLTIKLTINGVDFMDESFLARVGAGGTQTMTYTSGASNQVGNALNSGDGYVSYDIFGGFYSFDLTSLGVTDGIYDISYVMTSQARGNVSSTTACRAPSYFGGGENEVPQLAADRLVEEGPFEDSYASFCGAGAQSGDPFPPLARAQLQSVPEPGSLALMGLAGVMLALSGAKRRRRTQS